MKDKKKIFFESIEWIGMLNLLGAYTGNAFEFFTATSWEYIGMNFIGGLLVGISVLRKKAYATATLEFIWMGIAIFGIFKAIFS